MNYKRNDLEAGKIEIRGEATEAEIVKQRDAAVRRLSKNLKVSGFRAGKIPAEVAMKHIDPNLLTETVINEVLNLSLNEILVREKVMVAGQPHVDVTKFVPWTTLEFTATVEMVPPVGLPNLTKLTTKREEPKIDADEVDKVLATLAGNTAE
jgi:trigger factor